MVALDGLTIENGSILAKCPSKYTYKIGQNLQPRRLASFMGRLTVFFMRTGGTRMLLRSDAWCNHLNNKTGAISMSIL